MSDKRISQLIPGSTLVGTEPIPMVQGGQTVATTPNAISALIKPYKVYTALLTQSGGDNTQHKAQGDTLDLGVTYQINQNTENVDLTIFGAPNSNVETTFVCTQAGTLPVIGTIDLQYNTGAPLVTVLENTIGNIWWSRNTVGAYLVMSDSLFTDFKTTIFMGPLYDGLIPTKGYCVGGVNNSITGQELLTVSGTTLLNSDDLLYNTSIEIRVYN